MSLKKLYTSLSLNYYHYYYVEASYNSLGSNLVGSLNLYNFFLSYIYIT